MRNAIRVAAASAITSPQLRALARFGAGAARRLTGARPLVRYFHQVDDPYSHLAAQCLKSMMAAYDVTFEAYLAPPPDEAAAPEAAKLATYARRDAYRLARTLGLSFPKEARAPGAEAVAAVQGKLAAARGVTEFVEIAIAEGEKLWRGAAISDGGDGGAAVREGGALREKLGHYLGGVFHYEGEWYWGPDRLPYLEERLAFARRGAPVVRRLREGAPELRATGAKVDFFLSPRSPYTYLAAKRVRLLCERWGAELVLRPVLPMVMRGLPVPPMKRLYIVRDTKREAETFGMPFGRIADPVGAGAERGLAVLHHAIPIGLGSAFAESFLAGVFSEGIDAATDDGFAQLATRAGLTRAQVNDALADESWRAVAEANREEMFGFGVWGVPSFRVRGFEAHWGQDRLWAVEEDLRAAASSATLEGAA